MNRNRTTTDRALGLAPFCLFDWGVTLQHRNTRPSMPHDRAQALPKRWQKSNWQGTKPKRFFPIGLGWGEMLDMG